MRQPASFIVTKTQILFHPTSNFHTEIRRYHKLNEEPLLDPAHIRTVAVKFVPPNQDFGAPPSEWKLKVDQNVLPHWFDPDKTRKAILDYALPKWKEHHILHIDHNKQCCYPTIFKYPKETNVIQLQESEERFYYSTPSYDPTILRPQFQLKDKATLTANDSLQAHIYNSSHLTLYDPSYNVNRLCDAEIIACDNSKVFLTQSLPNLSITLYDNASINAPFSLPTHSTLQQPSLLTTEYPYFNLCGSSYARLVIPYSNTRGYHTTTIYIDYPKIDHKQSYHFIELRHYSHLHVTSSPINIKAYDRTLVDLTLQPDWYDFIHNSKSSIELYGFAALHIHIPFNLQKQKRTYLQYVHTILTSPLIKYQMSTAPIYINNQGPFFISNLPVFKTSKKKEVLPELLPCPLCLQPPTTSFINIPSNPHYLIDCDNCTSKNLDAFNFLRRVHDLTPLKPITFPILANSAASAINDWNKLVEPLLD